MFPEAYGIDTSIFNADAIIRLCNKYKPEEATSMTQEQKELVIFATCLALLLDSTDHIHKLHPIYTTLTNKDNVSEVANKVKDVDPDLKISDVLGFASANEMIRSHKGEDFSMGYYFASDKKASTRMEYFVEQVRLLAELVQKLALRVTVE